MTARKTQEKEGTREIEAEIERYKQLYSEQGEICQNLQRDNAKLRQALDTLKRGHYGFVENVT